MATDGITYIHDEGIFSSLCSSPIFCCRRSCLSREAPSLRSIHQRSKTQRDFEYADFLIMFEILIAAQR